MYSTAQYLVALSLQLDAHVCQPGTRHCLRELKILDRRCPPKEGPPGPKRGKRKKEEAQEASKGFLCSSFGRLSLAKEAKKKGEEAQEDAKDRCALPLADSEDA